MVFLGMGKVLDIFATPTRCYCATNTRPII